MLDFIFAILAMALKDSINTVMVIMQAHGRSKLAGNLAAGSDLAGLLVTVTSAGLVIQHGWNLKTAGVVVAMMITSKIGTTFWTKIGSKIAKEGEQGLHDHAIAEIPVLSQRITALEKQIGVPTGTVSYSYQDENYVAHPDSPNTGL